MTSKSNLPKTSGEKGEAIKHFCPKNEKRIVVQIKKNPSQIINRASHKTMQLPQIRPKLPRLTVSLILRRIASCHHAGLQSDGNIITFELLRTCWNSKAGELTTDLSEISSFSKCAENLSQ